MIPQTGELTREGWLTAAAGALAPVFAAADIELPASVAVSCGFPGGAPILKTIGQCWKTATALDGRAHIFVSPLLHDPVEVLEVLAHELVHAVDDCEHKHRGPFAKMARAIGLEGKLTATHAGPELRLWLEQIAAELGDYPHAGLVPETKPKTQSTRMRKVECPACGYIVRTTAKWLAVGVPTCPCETEMIAEPDPDEGEPGDDGDDEGEAA